MKLELEKLDLKFFIELLKVIFKYAKSDIIIFETSNKGLSLFRKFFDEYVNEDFSETVENATYIQTEKKLNSTPYTCYNVGNKILKIEVNTNLNEEKNISLYLKQ